MILIGHRITKISGERFRVESSAGLKNVSSNATTIDLKRVIGEYLNQGSDSDNFYLAIGKSEPYQPGFGDTPPVTADSDVSSLSYERKTRNALQTN